MDRPYTNLSYSISLCAIFKYTTYVRPCLLCNNVKNVSISCKNYNGPYIWNIIVPFIVLNSPWIYLSWKLQCGHNFTRVSTMLSRADPSGAAPRRAGGRCNPSPWQPPLPNQLQKYVRADTNATWPTHRPRDHCKSRHITEMMVSRRLTLRWPFCTNDHTRCKRGKDVWPAARLASLY